LQKEKNLGRGSGIASASGVEIGHGGQPDVSEGHKDKESRTERYLRKLEMLSLT
jgi:hypothetical protein